MDQLSTKQPKLHLKRGLLLFLLPFLMNQKSKLKKTSPEATSGMILYYEL
jgi:hypothetical protein